jgi:predicted nucleic acid-binding protein
VRYLLDVNVLVALGLQSHKFHPRVAAWLLDLSSSDEEEVATCSITELGFVRVVSQVKAYGYSLPEALFLLQRVKARSIVKFTFVADDQGVAALPRWVKSPKHLTDGHLANLAESNDALLATLDTRIPGGFLIPD